MRHSDENVQPGEDRTNSEHVNNNPNVMSPEEKYVEFMETYQDISDISDRAYDASPTFESNLPWILIRAISRAIRRI